MATSFRFFTFSSYKYLSRMHLLRKNVFDLYKSISRRDLCVDIFIRSKKCAKTRNPKTQPSKPKREITKITNCQNTKRTYGQTE